MQVNQFRYCVFATVPGMSSADPKTYLWSNIEALMGGGKQSIDSVQKRTRSSRGTIQRIKEAKTSVGIDLLMEVAKAFDIEIWELLTPREGKAQPQAKPQPPSLSEALSVLAEHLLRLDGPQRQEAVQRLTFLVHAPDSEIARAEAAQTIASLGEKPVEQEPARRSGTNG